MSEQAAYYETGSNGCASVQTLKPCPFCGASDFSENLWSMDDGEVDAIECNTCYAAAPASAWNRRAGT